MNPLLNLVTQRASREDLVRLISDLSVQNKERSERIEALQNAALNVLEYLTGDDDVCAAFSSLAGGATEQFKDAVEKLDSLIENQ